MSTKQHTKGAVLGSLFSLALAFGSITFCVQQLMSAAL